MQDLMVNALKGHNADYVELRLETLDGNRISYRGRDLEDISSSLNSGGCARAYVNGAWGFVTFTKTENLRSKVELAVQQARMANGNGGSIIAADPVITTIDPVIEMDPFEVTIEQKVDNLKEYIEALWTVETLQSTSINYGDRKRTTHFANSEGSYIAQERIDVTLGARAVAKKENDVQQYGISIGSLGDYGIVLNLEKQMKEISEKANDLLLAPQLDGGEYTVICDPILGGVFAHEAFGHLSESDFIYENQQMKEIMVLGRKFGGNHLNIVDGASIPGLRGSYDYDDEGVPSQKSQLIHEGKLVGRLHSRETASKMGESTTGNARAIDYRHPPIVRMTNTYIEPGEATVEELISEVKDGVYAKNWYGGMTSMEMFTFSAGEAYRIRNGKVEELLRPVVLSGNVFTTLENLDAVANDLDMNQGGGCGKAGQSPLAVSNGSPHIRIQNCLLGGS
jgi:TldD protein